MNARYDEPEIIGSVGTIDKQGNDEMYGSHVVGISCESGDNNVPLIQLDVRNFKGGNIMIKVELLELVSAIGLATFRKGGAA